MPDGRGRIDVWDLGQGWAVAPYPAELVHWDGSTGDLFECPDCRRRLKRGESLRSRAYVVAARVYLRHFDDDYARMNAVYATYFSPGRLPARTCIGVTGLARGARVEIDMIARRG